MPRNKRRPKASDDLLFAAAERACRDLRLFLAGELELSDAQVQAKRGLIREASEKSFYFFAKVVLGYDKLTNQTHKKWCSELQSKWLSVSRFMRLKPRGTYKTTIYGVAFILFVWAACSPAIRIFYTSANQTLLDEVSAEIRRHLNPDTLYGFVFGIVRDKTAKNTEDVVNIVGRSATKGSSLMLRTAGGATNGIHPHMIIVDDPMDKDDRESEAVRARKTRWFDSLTPLLTPFSLKLSNGVTVEVEKIMFIATRWHLQDLVHYVLGKDGSVWDLESEGVYAKDGTPRYPEFMPEEKIDRIRRAISEVFFACQYLNDPLPEGSRIFGVERLHMLRPEQVDVKQGANWCFFDPSQGKSGSDYPAPIWVNVNTRRVIFDAIDTKFDLDTMLMMIAQKNKELGARGMIFETNGAMGLESTILTKHQNIGYTLGLYPIHETANKVERIYAMQPELYGGNWFFMSDWEERYKELMSQLIFFPAWGHDDFPDVIEKAVTWTAQNMPGDFGRSGGGERKGTFSGSISRNGKASW